MIPITVELVRIMSSPSTCRQTMECLMWINVVKITVIKRVDCTSSWHAQYMYDLFFRVTDEAMPGFGQPPTSLWRRYSEFELLRNYLEITYPAVVVPPLPEKRVSWMFSACFLTSLCRLKLTDFKSEQGTANYEVLFFIVLVICPSWTMWTTFSIILLSMLSMIRYLIR